MKRRAWTTLHRLPGFTEAAGRGAATLEAQAHENARAVQPRAQKTRVISAMSDLIELSSIPDIQKQLRALRKAKGWTQAVLAEKLKVKQPRIAEIEANPGVVNLEQFLRVIEALGGRLALKPGRPSSGDKFKTIRKAKPS
jgi:ribosome-binding protein aMBF1 (putative translation factor)